MEFDGSLAYQDTEMIKNVTVAYEFSKKDLKVTELNQAKNP
ncbi:hypothetical protein ABID47_004383 [Paenibacillus favisporus]|uniref:Uncharacterized protein n=1 Tax=Paenibacillus favisporus TaxID=221028 RepID=A0ABV2F7K5_9BACL